MQEMLKRCSTFLREGGVRDLLPFPLSPRAHQSRGEAVHDLCTRKPVSPELIHEAAADVLIRCHQVVVIACNSLLRAEQCVCASRVLQLLAQRIDADLFTKMTNRRTATRFQVALDVTVKNSQSPEMEHRSVLSYRE